MFQTINHGTIRELKLARPPVNALSPDLVKALRSAIADAPGTGARAIVLSGQPGMFSAGLDVPALLALDRAGITAFWDDFFGLIAAIGRSPIPIVAAITGHSPAGGAVLSIFCDYRIMARGMYRIGLNEVQVGLTVPDVIQEGLRRLIGPHKAERLMVAGAMIESEEALRVGMVDELADVDHVITRALAWCEQHLALPPLAMAATRRYARRDLAEMLGDTSRFPSEEFAANWFGEETQRTLREMMAKLKAKSAA